MSFIPENELKGQSAFSMAPMIDFLFLMLMFFACLAISRVSLKDTELDLVQLKNDTHPSLYQEDTEFKIIHISINSNGEYRLTSSGEDQLMKFPNDLTHELVYQYEKGLIPDEKGKTRVLLKIDKQATWDPILKAIFAIRDAGFDVRPVYQWDGS